jgi:hypothetical protein
VNPDITIEIAYIGPAEYADAAGGTRVATQLIATGADIIFGMGGNDIICAGNGNDVVVTGNGNDIIDTGNGNDTVESGAGVDFIDTGDGNDRVTTRGGNKYITTGRGNANEAVADMTVAGLTATEVLFMNQTDPDGKPLGLNAALLVVPTALKVSANTLMRSERLITGASATMGEANPYAGRFRVESSPYMSNSTYTGYSAAAWYMLADPNEMPVIEIAALNGRVEPVIETADADFNVLGVQMRGYSDVGVEKQEYRAGVRADGGSS